MIAANTIIGSRYKVIRLLGGGGMKQVYLAEDMRLASRPCALAEMVDTFTKPEMQKAAVNGFQREADMLAELSHEHIPRVYDRFSDQNHHYLVMEFVDGLTLEQMLKDNGGKVSEREMIDIALQVLDTLDYLHRLNPPVIYRDLKPSNIMLSATGELKLVDFGIARHFQPLSNATMIGTQGYAPPEQYRGKVEIRSDLYALGATMHHALSGRDPTTEAPFSFPPLEKSAPGVNPHLAALVNQSLAYDVNRRVPSAADFKRQLLSIKIETLTNGLLPSDEAAEALAAAAQPTSRPQLKLPLTNPAPVASASPNAPTLLTDAADAPCTSCGRFIAADSRYCAYCGADLTRPLTIPTYPGRAGSEAETIVLSSPSSSMSTADRYSIETRHGHYQRRRRRSWGFRGLAMLFFAAFLAVRSLPWLQSVLASLGEPSSESSREVMPPDSGFPGFSPPREEMPSNPGPGSHEPTHQSARAIALRRALDELGYRQVHFRLLGNSAIELWGAVPSEADKLMVETTAFSLSGVVSLDDHVQVQEDLAEP